MDEKEIIGKLILFSVAMVLLFAYTVFCLWRTEKKLKKANDELLAFISNTELLSISLTHPIDPKGNGKEILQTYNFLKEIVSK